MNNFRVIIVQKERNGNISVLIKEREDKNDYCTIYLSELIEYINAVRLSSFNPIDINDLPDCLKKFSRHTFQIREYKTFYVKGTVYAVTCVNADEPIESLYEGLKVCISAAKDYPLDYKFIVGVYLKPYSYYNNSPDDMRICTALMVSVPNSPKEEWKIEPIMHITHLKQEKIEADILAAINSGRLCWSEIEKLKNHIESFSDTPWVKYKVFENNNEGMTQLVREFAIAEKAYLEDSKKARKFKDFFTDRNRVL